MVVTKDAVEQCRCQRGKLLARLRISGNVEERVYKEYERECLLEGNFTV
jgi:hypothetical protein